VTGLRKQGVFASVLAFSCFLALAVSGLKPPADGHGMSAIIVAVLFLCASLWYLVVRFRIWRRERTPDALP